MTKGEISSSQRYSCGGLLIIARFDEVIQACSLRHDLDMLPDGQHTEIGEKGINLSGKPLYQFIAEMFPDMDIFTRRTEGRP